jgi:signal transduction histidine kinase
LAVFLGDNQEFTVEAEDWARLAVDVQALESMSPSSRRSDLLHGAARFGQFVTENWQRITRHWVTIVDRSPEVPASDDLTYRQLVDHLPEICHELGSVLKQPEIPDIRDQAAQDAAAHGRKRWQQGYDLSQLIRELCLIRNDVLNVWLDVFARDNGVLDDESKGLVVRMVQRFFDDIVIESAMQFASEQIAEMQTINAARVEAEGAAASAKSKVLRHVSHTLREPLAAISFAAEALTTEPEMSGEARKNVQIIVRNIKLQAQNVNELLAAAQLALRARPETPAGSANS